MTSPAVEVVGVSHHFGGKPALDAITVTIEHGKIFGFLGPDGGGKTTLFRILTTLIEADEGSARVLGLDVKEDLWALRKRLGYMPGRFSLYSDLTVEENLRFFATVFGTTIEAQYDIIAPIYRQIEPFKDRAAGALSGGMKQKLALSCALVHRPDILSSTSRRPAWTRSLVGNSGTSSLSSRREASPSSSRPHTWTRPTGAIASL